MRHAIHIHILRAIAASVAIVVVACQTTRGAEASVRREAPHEPWRERRPPAGPAVDFKLPTFARAELKNGMVLYFVEDHSLPMLSAAVVLRAGSAHESAKDAGLASLTYDMLAQGAGAKNQLELANAFAQLGSELHSEAARDYGMVSTTLLTTHIDAGLDLLATVVEKPTFAALDFERVRQLATDAVLQKQGDPGELAGALSNALVFAAEHPYGHDAQGTASSLKTLTAARVKQFWSQHAGPKNAALVLVGDVSFDDAKKFADKHFGKWKGSAAAPKPPPDPKPRAALSLAFVDMPGAPQSVVRIARAVMAKGDSDEAAMVVMNAVLGGTFSSRINLKLREENGWTYGAFSGFDARAGKGPFVVTTDVQADHTADTVVELLALMDAMKTAGATDDELLAAKDGYSKSLPSLLGLPVVQVAAAAELFAYELPLMYHAQLLDKVKAVTADDVKRVAARTLVKEDFVFVVVGDKASCAPKLTSAGLGDVVTYDKNGVIAK